MTLLFLFFSCFLLASSMPLAPLKAADSFQSTLNRAIVQKNQNKINELIDADKFYATPCKGNRIEKDAFTASLISSARAGAVTSARDDAYYMYYSVNYGDKWSWVYILNSEFERVHPNKLLSAKQIDCRFVDN